MRLYRDLLSPYLKAMYLIPLIMNVKTLNHEDTKVRKHEKTMPVIDPVIT